METLFYKYEFGLIWYSKNLIIGMKFFAGFSYLNQLKTKINYILINQRQFYISVISKFLTPAPKVKSHYFRHGGSYKRLFLEKHLQSCIEKFIPQQTDLFDIKDLLGVMEPYIKRLEVTELLPPTLILVSIIKTLQVLQYRQESLL